MGINTVIYCIRHEVKNVSMRGEEGADLQWWFREHKECFEDGAVKITNDTCDYPQDWPDAIDYDNRPDKERKQQRSAVIRETREALGDLGYLVQQLIETSR